MSRNSKVNQETLGSPEHVHRLRKRKIKNVMEGGKPMDKLRIRIFIIHGVLYGGSSLTSPVVTLPQCLTPRREFLKVATLEKTDPNLWDGRLGYMSQLWTRNLMAIGTMDSIEENCRSTDVTWFEQMSCCSNAPLGERWLYEGFSTFVVPFHAMHVVKYACT